MFRVKHLPAEAGAVTTGYDVFFVSRLSPQFLSLSNHVFAEAACVVGLTNLYQNQGKTRIFSQNSKTSQRRIVDQLSPAVR